MCLCNEETKSRQVRQCFIVHKCFLCIPSCSRERLRDWMRRQVSEWSRRRHNFHDQLSFSSLLPIIFPKRGKAVSVHADCTDKSAMRRHDGRPSPFSLFPSPIHWWQKKLTAHLMIKGAGPQQEHQRAESRPCLIFQGLPAGCCRFVGRPTASCQCSLPRPFTVPECLPQTSKR